MKKAAVISFLICLFSFAVFAQAKAKPKIAAKPVATKPANAAQAAKAKPVDKKSANTKTKPAAPEKSAAEKSKSAKSTPTKTQNDKAKNDKAKSVSVKTEKAKIEKKPALKVQTAKNQAEKKDAVKNPPVKNQFIKTDAAKKTPVKSSSAPAKSNAASSVAPAVKSGVKNPVKAASVETVKPAPDKTATVKPPKPAESAAPPVAETNLDAGSVVGKTYYNDTFNFSVAVPDDWEIADEDFARRLKTEGFSLSLEPPKAKTASAQNSLNAAAARVQILLTAFKASRETNKNAILRVSVEDLRRVPQIKDAVDYFDSMRATYQNVKLPANFKYSETQAEKLGAMQFGFLDITSGTSKKRMYATVRRGFALMFTLTYTSDEDLDALKSILAGGDFRRQ